MEGANCIEKNNKKVRIKDAFKEDAGRGIIRIDPDLINTLNLKIGDAVLIMHPAANTKTVALLATGKEEDRYKKIIRLDPSLRRNLTAAVDDIVEIKRIEAEVAESVTFAGLNDSMIPRDPQALARKLENRVIIKGDNLSYYAMAHRIDLVVVDFTPKVDAIKINLNTKIIFSIK